MNVLKNRKVGQNDAVMFDIDNTLIFTNGKANTPIIHLLYGAIVLGYTIIIITARPAILPSFKFTQTQLDKYNIPYHHLYLTPAHNKGNVKRQTGFNYILSVGDMDTDLTDSLYALKC
jgi:hypothetical protein